MKNKPSVFICTLLLGIFAVCGVFIVKGANTPNGQVILDHRGQTVLLDSNAQIVQPYLVFASTLPVVSTTAISGTNNDGTYTYTVTTGTLAAQAGQVLVTGTSLKVYLTGSTGLNVSSGTVGTF